MQEQLRLFVESPPSIAFTAHLLVSAGRRTEQPKARATRRPERTTLYVRIAEERERRDATVIGPGTHDGLRRTCSTTSPCPRMTPSMKARSRLNYWANFRISY